MGWICRLLGKPETAEVPFAEVSDANFEQEVLRAGLPVMLFAWSNTCPHCRKMAPNVQQIARMYQGRIKSTHTNATLSPDALSRLNLRGVPATLFFNGGQLIQHVGGFRPVSYLDELIQTHFGGSDITPESEE